MTGTEATPATTRPPKQEQEHASDEITEVAPGILRLQLPISMPGLGHVNTYALEDEDGFTLVDPGLPGEESWKALQSRMAAADIPMNRVHHVIVTHSHPDHFGGAGMLAEESGAEVVASTFFRLGWDRGDDGGEPDLEPNTLGQNLLDDTVDDDELAERYTMPSPWGGDSGRLVGEERQVVLARRREMFQWFRIPKPSVRVDDSDRLRLGGREWMGVYTPGHTNDHLCLFDPEGGVLLSGDHVLPTITPHISGLIEGDPLKAYLDSLDRVAAFEGVTTVLPAHGHPFRDLPGRVDAIKSHHAERLEQLRFASQDRGWASVTELMQDLFRERSWGHMAESETFAHVEHLRLLGRAERREESGYLLYLVA
jgi:glyoxylase-like metal-dependent hydrolase (beta-lactamase superfamily II)